MMVRKGERTSPVWATSWMSLWSPRYLAGGLCWSVAVLGITALSARGDESWVGKQVIQRDADFALQVGSKVIDRRGTIEIYSVEQVKDSWLWLHAEQSNLTGWAKADTVVSMDEAIPFFAGEIHANPEDPLPHVLRAKVWLSKNQPDVALKDLNDAIRLDPSHAWVHNWRGILYREKGQYERAIADHTEAIQLEPGNALSYVNRALAYIDLQQYEKAIDDFNQAIRFDPENAGSFNKRGWTRYCMGDYDKAIEDFNQAIGINPDLQDAFTNRGMTWFAKNESDKAIADFTRALELDPRDAITYNDRGWAWERKNNHDKAMADFNEALRCRPKFVRAYTNRGIVWAAKKDFDKAIEDFNNALQIDPERARPYTNRGIALAAKGDFDRAINDFDHALKLQPDSAWTRYNRLLASLSSGRPEAADEAHKLLAQIGWNDELSVHTALVGYFAELRAGRMNEAGTFLKDAAAHCDSKQWTYKIVSHLRGEINEKQLLEQASTLSRQTQIHSFLGLNKALTGQSEAAITDLRWVAEHGVSSNAEYPIALAELDRIQGKNRDGSKPRTAPEYADQRAGSSRG